MAKAVATTTKEGHNRAAVALHDPVNVEIVKKRMLRLIKGSAKQSGVPFDLSLENIPDLPAVCPIFHLILDYRWGGRPYKPNRATIDKIDPRRGYIPGNIRIISWRANICKRDMTIEEITQLANFYKEAA